MVEAGARLGDRFVVVGELGQDDMVTVYLAEDLVSGALGELELVHESLIARRWVRQRVCRDLRAAAAVAHARVAAGEAHEIEGRLARFRARRPAHTLQRHVQDRGALTRDALDLLAVQLCEALTAVHEAGLVHGALHPSRVLLGEQGAVLADLGLSRLVAQRAEPSPFAAPEVLAGVRVDPRSDLYALGAILRFAGGDSALVDALTAEDPEARPTSAALLAALGKAARVRDPRPADPIALPSGDWAVVLGGTGVSDDAREALRSSLGARVGLPAHRLGPLPSTTSFRLVSGVDRSIATALAEQARAHGFTAVVVPAVGLAAIGRSALAYAGAGLLGAGAFVAVAGEWVLVPAFWAGLLSLFAGRYRRDRDVRSLPLAFDPAAHRTPGHRWGRLCHAVELAIAAARGRSESRFGPSGPDLQSLGAGARRVAAELASLERASVADERAVIAAADRVAGEIERQRAFGRSVVELERALEGHLALLEELDRREDAIRARVSALLALRDAAELPFV